MENIVLGSFDKDELLLVNRVIKSLSLDSIAYFSEVPGKQIYPLTNFERIAENAKKKAWFAKESEPGCIAVAFGTGTENKERYNAVTYEFEPYTLFIGVVIIITPNGREILCAVETTSIEKKPADLCYEALSSALLSIM